MEWLIPLLSALAVVVAAWWILPRLTFIPETLRSVIIVLISLAAALVIINRVLPAFL